MFFFFFFQAEDGIRDPLVTGVQTCALPIFSRRLLSQPRSQWSESRLARLCPSLHSLSSIPGFLTTCRRRIKFWRWPPLSPFPCRSATRLRPLLRSVHGWSRSAVESRTSVAGRRAENPVSPLHT